MHPESEGLSAWFLHADYLDATVAAQIAESGYANVYRLQVVAQIGRFWAYQAKGVPLHLHFEVRRDDETLVDPYGWNGEAALWD